MGATKDLMEPAGAYLSHGDTCLWRRSLEECKRHGGLYFDGGSDVDGAYRLANAGITAGTIQLPPGVSRHDFTDAIKKAYEENSGVGGCPHCAQDD
jgi:hypothetical protein